MIDLRLGDCLEVMRETPDASVDSIVTDPPAGIAFMGKEWDTFPKGKRGVCCKTGNGNPCESHGFARDVHWDYGPNARDGFIAFLSQVFAECLRVAKPGAHALVWALPRTSHWTGMALEDAGWRIDDRIAHHFGTGFPKHKSKLKPATEDWWLCTKPGGDRWLNVDGCRIGTSGATRRSHQEPYGELGRMDQGGQKPWRTGHEIVEVAAGRWPTNLVLTHHPECNGECVEGCPVAEMDGQSGERTSNSGKPFVRNVGGFSRELEGRPASSYGSASSDGFYGDSGGASRFYPTFAWEPADLVSFLYCSKASRKDRGEANTHPTVKPIALMRWLTRLVTPAGGTVLDPFMGSGSTGLACSREGFKFIGIEREPAYLAIAESRIKAETETPFLFGPATA